MNEKDRIIALSNIFGPSGFEDQVQEMVCKELEGYDLVCDSMRNVRAYLGEEKKPRVMLDAHMDEVGLIIQAIKPNGTLRFLTLGGVNKAALPGNSFRILTREGKYIPSVVAVKPPHFMKDRNSEPSLAIEDMVLDCGTSSKEETEALGIGIGCVAVADVDCRYDDNRGLYYGKAFDDRIGVAVEIEVMKRLKQEECDVHVCASFSTQEEVGERGVSANAAAYKPDVMICLEGCPADDTFQEDYMIQAAIGKGTMLRHFDTSMITNWRYQRFAIDVAKKYSIPFQEAVRSGGGTNAAMVNKQFGVPAIVISVPVRYIHSSYCWMSEKDYKAAVELCLAIIKELNEDVIKGF